MASSFGMRMILPERTCGKRANPEKRSDPFSGLAQSTRASGVVRWPGQRSSKPGLVPAMPTATIAALLAGLGFVDGQGPSFGLLAVQGRDGLLGFLVGAHLH